MITKIESSANSVFKSTKKLLNSRDRRKNRLFITEGLRSVSDACRHNAPVEYIIINESYCGECFEDKYRIYRFSDRLFDEISSTVNSQGILAVVRFIDRDISELSVKKLSGVVYLDSVADPGNMGTILRTSDAMGVDAVVLSGGCVDMYNPKVVRSTMASIFSVPVYIDAGGDALALLKARGMTVAGTFVDGAVSCFDADLCTNTVIVMGNEANGISDAVAKMCDTRITVPMHGGAESLNVAVCCAMLLYEQMRQKIKTGGVDNG